MSEIISITVTNMVYIVYLARYHGKLNGAYPEHYISDYAYFYLTRVGISCLLEWFCFTISLLVLTYKLNLPLLKLWRKNWKWYILVTVTQSCFIVIYAIVSNHVTLLIDSDIVQNHKYGIPESSTLLNCNVTKVSFWSQ